MFGIGLPELIVIAAVALIFIGPKNLPGVLRSLGRGLVQIKRATNDVRHTVQEEMDRIEDEIDLKDVKNTTSELKKDFDGVTSKFDSLSLNRMNTGEKLEAVANVMDPKNDSQKEEREKYFNPEKDKQVETKDTAPVPPVPPADQKQNTNNETSETSNSNNSGKVS